MEGRYTKLGTIVGVLGLVVAIWQVRPKAKNNIDGEWTMTTMVKEADLKKYVGLEIKWKLFLTETENKIKGTGEKLAINGADLKYNERTTMDLEGNIRDGVITLNYIENGKMRRTTGIFIAKVKGHKFRGNFSQTAANTKGEITGVKITK